MSPQKASPTEELSRLGVSIWLDDLSRERLTSGNLRELIESRNVVGVTTNPTIFAQALKSDGGYADELEALAKKGFSPESAAIEMMCADVTAACDLFTETYEASDGVDGRVSIEVSPALANDSEATVEAGVHLWNKISRDNLLIKVPATKAGLTAITELISRGISVNVTLIFSLPRYREVVNAYLTGIERARAAGREVQRIHSVASFFVSRVDTAVDAQLRALGTDEALELLSKSGVANAQLAYEIFRELFSTERALMLLNYGANPQRPLWASTGVKDATLSDTLYVSELVGEHVVNTMPQATLDAVSHHGLFAGDTLSNASLGANHVLNEVAQLGISYESVVSTLETEGIQKFVDSYAEMLDTVARGMQS